MINAKSSYELSNKERQLIIESLIFSSCSETCLSLDEEETNMARDHMIPIEKDMLTLAKKLDSKDISLNHITLFDSIPDVAEAFNFVKDNFKIKED